MHNIHRSTQWCGLSILSAFVALVGAAEPPVQADDRSWSALETLRTTLNARSPVAVDFQQTLIPEGFGPEDGESESGLLAMNLPAACLRWDYLGDFEKSFLLCDSDGYYWNPGEVVGSIFSLDGKEDAPGLDFFLQKTAALQARYQASSNANDGKITIDLVPNTPTEDVVALRLIIDTQTGLLNSMSYDDVDGNQSLFVLTNYRAHTDTSSFSPPDGVAWESQ